MKLSSNNTVQEQEDLGRAVHVRDVNGELQYDGEGDGRTPVTITVAGTYSARYRRAEAAQRDRVIKRRRQVTGEELTERQAELVSACVITWTPMEWDGQPLPCTVENVEKLLKAYPWIREQLEEAMRDHEGFSRSSSST